MIEIYTDGATVGWNGKLGTVKEVGIGVWCPAYGYEFADRVDGISNNEAEFKALIKGMEWALNENVKEAIFYSDSKIIVNRANGKKPRKKKHQNEQMDAFQDKVLELAKRFKDVSFEWIPREENYKADYLSNYYI